MAAFGHERAATAQCFQAREAQMIFLAITPEGLDDTLKFARDGDHVWCGRNAISDEQNKTEKRKVSIFTYAFTGAGGLNDLQGAICTMQEHHPGHTVWVEQTPAE